MPAPQVTRLGALVPNAPHTASGIPDNVAAALINWAGGYNDAERIASQYEKDPPPLLPDPKT